MPTCRLEAEGSTPAYTVVVEFRCDLSSGLKSVSAFLDGDKRQWACAWLRGMMKNSQQREEDTKQKRRKTRREGRKNRRTHLVVAATKPRSSNSSSTFGTGFVARALRPIGRWVRIRRRKASICRAVIEAESAMSAESGSTSTSSALSTSGLFGPAPRIGGTRSSWRSHGRYLL